MCVVNKHLHKWYNSKVPPLHCMVQNAPNLVIWLALGRILSHFGGGCVADVWKDPQVQFPTPHAGRLGEWKVVIEIKLGENREWWQWEVEAGAGLGSLSMGSAHFSFKGRVRPIACGAVRVFAFEEY